MSHASWNCVLLGLKKVCNQYPFSSEDRTLGGRMVGPGGSTGLWRPPKNGKYLSKFYLIGSGR